MVRASFYNWLDTTNDFKPGFFEKVIQVASDKLGNGGLLEITEASDETRFKKLWALTKDKEKFRYYGNAIHSLEHNLWVIRGERVYSSVEGEGSIRVIGLTDNERVPHNSSLQDSITHAVERGGIIVYNPIEGNLTNFEFHKYITAVDVFCSGVMWPFNGLFNFKPNKVSQDFFRDCRNKGNLVAYLVSNRGHSLEEMGASYMDLKFNPQGFEGDSEVTYLTIRDELKKALIDNAISPNEDLEKRSHLFPWFASIMGNIKHAREFQKWKQIAPNRPKDYRGIAQ